MQFSQLTLEKAIVEFRYDTAYAYWDNSGKAMTKIAGSFPRIELRDAQLSNVQADWWSEGLAFNFNHQKADITVDFPTNLENFKSLSGAVCDAVRDILEVRSFTRVGARYIISLQAKDTDEAKDIFAKMGLVAISPEKLQPFGKGKMEEGQVVIRYDGDDRGTTFRISHAEREISYKVPRPITVQTDKFSRHSVVFDVDCYSKKPVEAPVFIPGDYIRITYKTIENGLLPMVGL